MVQVNRTPGTVTRIAPLPHMFVIRDLVVDMANFFAQQKAVKPYLLNKKLPRCGTADCPQGSSQPKWPQCQLLAPGPKVGITVDHF